MEASIYQKNNGRYFRDQNGKEHLLFRTDARDFFRNKSRVPMHTFTDGETIPSLLAELTSRSKEILPYADDNSEYISHLIIDNLLVTRLMRTCAPLKVLELGCSNGRLSYHLAYLLGKFHPDSLLCLVDHEISNENPRTWLDTIASAKYSPEISAVISDYDKTNLADESFDIVFINAVDNVTEPITLIREAGRIVRENGWIVCLYNDTPLLESSFKLAFPTYTAYELTPMCGVLTVSAHSDEFFFARKDEFKDPVNHIICQLEDLRNLDFDSEAYYAIMRQIDDALSESILHYRIDKKLKLIELEEAVLNTILLWKKDPDSLNYKELDKALALLRSKH